VTCVWKKIAHKYVSDYAAKQNVDKTFGIYKNPTDNHYYIGDTPINIQDDNRLLATRNTKELRGYGNLY